MPTPLGPGSGGGIRINVYNAEASAQIDKGMAVALDDTATTTYLAQSIAEDMVAAIKYTGSGTGAQYIGVAAENIEAGKLGQVIVFGPAKVLSAAAITAGNALEPVGASAKYDDSGGNLVAHGTGGANAECGIALEAASGADVLIKAFVNSLAYDGGFQAP